MTTYPSAIAPDGSWFIFADWQGMTRIAFPGDKVKTVCELDRPYQRKPLVLRPDGTLWSSYALDLDPQTLKKVRSSDPTHNSPDPLNESSIVVTHSGDSVTVRAETHKLHPDTTKVQLGVDKPLFFDAATYRVFPDGSVVVFGHIDEAAHVALLVRKGDNTAQVAWCHPMSGVANGSPKSFRAAGKTYLGECDNVRDVAYLVVVNDDGSVASSQSCPAIAGPWVLDGLVWWQPDESTMCAGPSLGEITEQHVLSGQHVGRASVLEVSGRKLILPWHGISMLDLAPAKVSKSSKGKNAQTEISRKHKPDDEAMYLASATLLKPIAEMMAKRGVRVEWRACARGARRVEPQLSIVGHSDLCTYLLGYAMQNGGAAKLRESGATGVAFFGGNAMDDVLSAKSPTTVEELTALTAVLDSVGISRASALSHLHSLEKSATQLKLPLPLTPEALQYSLATVLSGLRGQHEGSASTPTASAFAEIAPTLRDHEGLRKSGVNGPEVALFLAIAGHRSFGAKAVEPILSVLAAMNPTYSEEVQLALG